jgi:two-component system, chemotaxis family, CheB/CheR fusion protein
MFLELAPLRVCGRVVTIDALDAGPAVSERNPLRRHLPTPEERTVCGSVATRDQQLSEKTDAMPAATLGLAACRRAADTPTVDLSNILDAVDVPIVVLRRDFMLVCFNKAAADAFRLSPSDIGCASRDISVFAGLARLEEQCSQVIASGVEARPDFHDGDKWFVVRISPCTTGDRQVTAIVLTFTNVTTLRASIDQAIYERECTKAILNTVTDPLVVLSADQRILSGNRAFYTMFLELAPLRTQLKEMLASSHAFRTVEVDHVFPGEGQRTLLLDARPLSLPGHSERRFLVSFRDITAHKQAEAANDLRAITERKEELRRSEAFLAEAQRLSLTGSFSWRVTTDEITWWKVAP